jgi:hypothetical protein
MLTAEKTDRFSAVFFIDFFREPFLEKCYPVVMLNLSVIPCI